MRYQIVDFILDTDQFELSLTGNLIHLEPQALELLVLLIENRDRVVTKEEINTKVWKGRIVSESALSSRIKMIRQVLGDDGRKQQFIRTAHKKGFRFVADVEEASAENKDDYAPASGGLATLEGLDRLTLPDKPSIAVLPFTNISGDPEQEYFSEGITEDIITALARIPRLFVVARHSTSGYKGQAIDIRKVGREQGVRYVLEGSVRRGGDKVRITAQLIDTTTGNHQWAERYDRELNDIFAVQDEITHCVTVAVQVELSAGEQAVLWAGGTKNVEAWENVVCGNEYAHQHSQGANQEARRLAERALLLDPGYANAWVLKGLTHYEDAMWDWLGARESSLLLGVKAAHRAIELQGFNPDGFMLLASLKYELCEFDEAVDVGQKAIALAPNHGPNLALFSAVLGRAGLNQEAAQVLRRAMRLSPIYPSWYVHVLATVCFANGEYDEALQAEQTFLDHGDPDSSFLPMARVWLAIILASCGHTTEARAACAEVFKHDSDFQIDDWWRFPRKDWTVRERAVWVWKELVSSSG